MRIEINENKLEKTRNKAIAEVNSSMKLDSAWLLICKEVITKRQNPKRFADVLKMC